MKHLKRLLVVMAAVVMAMALAVPAFAADPTYSITVTPSGNGVSIEGKTFSAYKLFDATYADTDADNENDAFAYTISTDNYFYKNTNAKAVLDKYFTFTNTSDPTVKSVSVKDGVTFNETAAYTLTDELNAIEGLFEGATADGTGTGTAKDAEENADTAIINNLPSAGYYLVTGSAAALNGNNNNIMASIALTTTQPTATIKAKVDAPSVDKTVDNPIDTANHENEKSIGDTVTFTIPTKVPDMTGYTKKYYFVLTDTLSKGLTYQKDAEIVMSIDGSEVELIEDTHYSITETAKDDGSTELKIVFKDFLDNFKDFAGADLTVTYTAILNDNAVLGNTGNSNTVKLTYSNNPNEESDGEGDEPGEGDAVGVTPESETKTYTTGVELIKVDGTDNTKKLEGVEFNITGTKLNDVKETTYDRFVKMTAAEAEAYDGDVYYLLNDGTYTKTVPVADGDGKNIDKYASATDKYKKVTETAFSKTDGEEVTYHATTDENGKITLSGLGAGTYTFTEIKTNEGYNLLNEPIVVVVSAKTKEQPADSGIQVFDAWQFKKDNETATTSVNEAKRFEITVENNKGTELPSTGGMGTTILYIIGAVLVIGAGVYLITKRRATKESNIESIEE